MKPLNENTKDALRRAFYPEDTTGRYGKGNIDLNNRKVVSNPDGSISTERSFSFWDDDEKKEILIPQVVDGKVVSEDEAIDHYYETGEYLGKFNDWREADAYAQQLHERNEWYYDTSRRPQLPTIRNR